MRRFILVSIVASVLGHHAIAEAAVRYVAVAGNDTANTCAVAGSPCATLAYAVSQATALDTIEMAAGIYKQSTWLTNPPSIDIAGGFDPTFTVQSALTPTYLETKNGRPLTVIYDGTTTGTLSLQRLTFRKSGVPFPISELEAYGGGLLVVADESSDVTLDAAYLTFERNKAAIGGGAALVTSGTATMTATIADSRFAKNKAGSCGGLMVDGIGTAGANLTVARTVFDSNSSFDIGGALCLSMDDYAAVLTTQSLERVTFVKNKSKGPAGALAVLAFPGNLDVPVTNSVFLKNKSGDLGGAVFLLSTPGEADEASDLRFSSFNNTVTANKSKSKFGAVYAVALPDFNPLFNNSDVSFHSRNDIMVGNDPDLDVVVSVQGTTTGSSDVDYGIFAGIVTAPAVTVTNGGNLSMNVDPLFVKKGKDLHLQAASPAIDAGTCAGAPVVDFDGEARPKGMTCDLGADEF